jgi:hypothetical protein
VAARSSLADTTTVTDWQFPSPDEQFTHSGDCQSAGALEASRDCEFANMHSRLKDLAVAPGEAGAET